MFGNVYVGLMFVIGSFQSFRMIVDEKMTDELEFF
jgi:hypothetical protein